MISRRVIALSSLAAIASLMTPRAMPGQSGYEIEVYGTGDMVLPRSLLLELHGSYIGRGITVTPATGGGVVDDRSRTRLLDPVCTDSSGPLLSRMPVGGAALAPGIGSASIGCRITEPATTTGTARSLLEVGTGITPWWDAAFYLFGSRTTGGPTTFDGESYRTRVRVPASWHWSTGVGVSTELEHERASGTWTLEVRPIVDRTFGRWYLTLNPTLERVVGGPVAGQGVNFSPSARGSYDLSRRLTAGLEYYGAYGQIGAFPSTPNRLQQLFGTIDLRGSPVWEFSAGLGFGLTPASDRLVGKIVIGRRLWFGRDTVTI